MTAALADLRAGKTLEPFVKTPEQGAAEVLYGLGSAGGRQGDELAAMIYLRLSLFLAAAEWSRHHHFGGYLRAHQTERTGDRRL